MEEEVAIYPAILSKDQLFNDAQFEFPQGILTGSNNNKIVKEVLKYSCTVLIEVIERLERRGGVQ